MRDILITMLAFGILPFILKQPYIGVLSWSWLSYMNPHRLGWGFATTIPFAQVTAITLFISMIINREDKSLPINSVVVIWLIFIAWMLITTIFSLDRELAILDYITVLKIQLIIFVSMMLMKSKDRIVYLIWTIYLSIGFFGIKGGVFAILTGGSFRIYGPSTSYIEENNALAVALLMVLPLGVFLFRYYADKRIRIPLGISMFLITVSIVASWSRGAFVAIGVVAAYYWWKSTRKFVTLLLLVPLLILIFLAMPQEWHDRMGSITEYEEDVSAMSRINSWKFTINVANDRVTGGGFGLWNKENYAKWASTPSTAYVAHSIYFHVLGEHGWLGLVLFFLVYYFAWRLAKKIQKRALERPDDGWIVSLSSMIQVSILAYASGGAFLSLSYFDLPWHLMSILVLLDYLQRNDSTSGAVESIDVARSGAIELR